MRASELIAALQAMVAQHGDLPVSYDGEMGAEPVTNVNLEDYPKKSIFLAAFEYTPMTPTQRLNAAVNVCPLDHWSWSPEHVEKEHGVVLRFAGITDFNAWVKEERGKPWPRPYP